MSVLVDESTVFDNISEYLTGDDILNLNRANMLTIDVKKNGLCQEIKKKYGLSLYHYRKDVEYRNGEQEEEFLPLVSQVRRAESAFGENDDYKYCSVPRVTVIVPQETKLL
jgi:hypothetical protein